MNSTTDPLDELLARLNDARNADEDIHLREASLEERTVSHDALVFPRSEVAKFRAENGLEQMHASGLHDSRTRRGTCLD